MADEAEVFETPVEEAEPEELKNYGKPAAKPTKEEKKQLRSEILKIAWPSVMELILTSLVGTVSMMMVGRLGPASISAVSITQQPRFLILSAFISLNVGSTAMIARFKGMDDRDSANAVMRQSLIITALISVVLSVVGFVFARPMILFMGAQSDTIDAATVYLRIQMAALLTNTFPLAISAALRGAGNTKASMYLNTVSNILNIVVSFPLIYGYFGLPALGTTGAAIGMVFGQLVSCFVGFAILFKKHQYVWLSFKQSWKFDFGLMRRMLKVGLPAMFEQVVMRIGLTTFAIIVAGLGTVMFATHNICMNVLSLSFMNGQAFGIAATTLVGQSLGRKRPTDAWRYTSETQKIATAISVCMAVAFFFFGKYFMMMFTDDPDVIAQGAVILRIIALVQPSQSAFQVLAGSLRGAGDTFVMAVIMTVSIMIIRPIVAWVGVNWMELGLIGAWVAVFLDQFARYVLAQIRYNHGKWVMRKV